MSENKPKVLITGASGLIGGLTWRNLGDKYEFSGLNRRAVPEIPNTQADITDFDAILPAFEGIDMVVHMANYTADESSWDMHLNMGIIGTRNVYEAARLNGVKRVVLGSTGDTTTGYEMDYPYGELAAGEYDKVTEPWRMLTHTDPTRPKSVYGACKVFCEALGHWYSDRYGMSVLCVRLGAVLAENRPTLRRQYPGFLEQQDCVDMIDRCLSAPESLMFDTFNAISNNDYRWRDIGHAKDVLGWEPSGRAESYDLEDQGGWHQVLADDQELRRDR
ncbi:MAG: NAD(P)-dependent oxidoreductase [SAR202 cluster bacterium]|nr:NAD(P)-dependent oxidoreductase [SAR202 cluster bacterium]MDP6514378.1 NAD(P)-dependent oxidoreductase [SAR202 cluster bacterium]